MERELLSIPVVAWLCAVGVLWGSTAMYLVRMQQIAAINGKRELIKYYNGFEHFVEICIASFTGFVGAVASYGVGASDPVIVLFSSICSLLNKSAIHILIDKFPIVVERLINSFFKNDKT